MYALSLRCACVSRRSLRGKPRSILTAMCARSCQTIALLVTVRMRRNARAESAVWGGLRLDTEEGSRVDLGGHAAIVPGDPAASELVTRIRSTDGDVVMPPRNHHKPLSESQKNLLEQWIREGGKYSDHWAFVAPKRGTPPMNSGFRDRIANWIDEYIVAQLDRHGLAPSDQAGRRTLIRRVSFDLLGVPPSRKEVADFVKDTSSNAWEKVIDRKLASPQFGERLAAVLARSRSLCGHQWIPCGYSMERMAVSQLRHHCVQFQSVLRQVYPGATGGGSDTRFHTFAENRRRVQSSQYEEHGVWHPGIRNNLAKYAGDRVRTTATTWLGVTLGCAECHDHKFDPFTIRDFYSFAAFFAGHQATGLLPGRSEGGVGVNASLF